MIKRKSIYFLIILLVMFSFLFVSCTKDISTEIKGNNNEYGVKIEGGNFDNGATLVVEKIVDSTIVEEIKTLMDNIDYNKEADIVIFDISVIKENVQLRPNGKVKVTIPLPKVDVSNYLVYHITHAGIEQLVATIDNNTIVFETESFSYFVVVEKKIPHTHSYGDFKYVDEHMHVRECGCGEMESEPHTFDEGKITKEPTESSTGLKVYTCSVCKGIKEEVLSKLPHTHSYGDFKYADEHMHVRECGCGEMEREPHTFDEGKITKEPTESSTGLKVYTCSVCKGTKEEVLSKLPHTHSYGDFKYADEHMHVRECGCGEMEREPHTFDEGKITKEPTETSTGLKVYTCSVCKGTKEEELSKLENKCTVTAISNDSNLGLIVFGNNENTNSYSGVIEIGSVITLRAKPSENASFVGWYQNNNKYDQESLITTEEMLVLNHSNNDYDVVAYFIKKVVQDECTVNAVSNDSNLGLIGFGNDETANSYSGVIEIGSVITLRAKPSENASFVGWYQNNNKYDQESLITTEEMLVLNHSNNDYDVVAYFVENEVEPIINEVVYDEVINSGSLYNGATSIYVSRNMFTVNGKQCNDITQVKGITCVWINANTNEEVDANVDPTLDDPYILAPAIVGEYKFVVRYTNPSNITTDICILEGFKVVENYFERITSTSELDSAGVMTHYAIIGEVNGKLYSMHFPSTGDAVAIPVEADENGIVALGNEYSYIFRLYNYAGAARHYPRDNKEQSTLLYDFRLGSGPYKAGTLDISDLELGVPNGDSGIIFRFNENGEVQISQPFMTSGGDKVYIRLVYDEILKDYVFTTMNTNKDTRESYPVYLYKEYVKQNPVEFNTYDVTILNKIYDENPVIINIYKDLLINGGKTDYYDVEKNIRIIFTDGKNEIIASPIKDELIGPSEPGEYKFIIEETSDGKSYYIVYEAGFSIHDPSLGYLYELNKNLTKIYDEQPVFFNVYKDLVINYGMVSFNEVEGNIRFVFRDKESEIIKTQLNGEVEGPSSVGDYVLSIEENTEKGYVSVYDVPFSIYEQVEVPKFEIVAKLDKTYDEMPVTFNAMDDLIINDGKNDYFEYEENLRFTWCSKEFEEIGKPSKGIVEGPVKPGEYELAISFTSDFGNSYTEVARISFRIENIETIE